MHDLRHDQSDLLLRHGFSGAKPLVLVVKVNCLRNVKRIVHAFTIHEATLGECTSLEKYLLLSILSATLNLIIRLTFSLGELTGLLKTTGNFKS
jgi:hypothetical protein